MGSITIDKRLWAAIALVWCVVLGLVLSWDRILSTSIDISYHLQVMEVVKGAFIIPKEGHVFMAEMHVYPKLSHRLAALASMLGRSELNGLTFVGCLAAAALWLCLFDQARRVSLAVLVSSAVLAVANVFLTRATLGGEIVGNFFFPQLVGEAVCVLLLVAGASLLSRSRLNFIIFATLAVLFCGCFHLVPTLKLAGAFMALLGVVWLRDLLQQKRIDALGLAGLVAIPAAILLSPFFWRMRWMAANNGSVNFGTDISLIGLAVAALVLLALSAFVLLDDVRKPADAADQVETYEAHEAREALAVPRRATVLLAALGAATAAAMLAQYAMLLLFQDGSVYAVLKHGFGVFTLLAFLIPLCLLMVLGDKVPAGLRMASPMGPALAFVAQAVLLLCLFLRPSQLDVPATNALLRDVREVRLTRGLKDEAVLFSAEKIPPVVNYMATIAMLQSPHGGNVLALLKDSRPNRPGDVPYVVSLPGDAYDKPGCRSGAPIGQVVVLLGPCIEPSSLAFKTGGTGVPYLRDGWGLPELGGIWSEGKRAVVEMPIASAQRGLPAARLEVAAFAFLPDEAPSRTVTVSIEGGPSETFTFTRQNAIRYDYILKIPAAVLQQPSLKVVFDIKDPMTPASLGLGPDTRSLGAGLEAMRIVPDQPSVDAGAKTQ